MRRASTFSGFASFASALLASACCWLPLLLLGLGAGTAAVGTVTGAIEKFQPVFAVGALALLGGAFYFTYRRPGGAPSAKQDCCTVPSPGTAAGRVCSCCGKSGKRVLASTVRALVHEQERGRVVEGDYVLCVNPACAQVYTAPSGAPLLRSDLAVRVGFKEQAGPHLVCFCFGHSVEDIEEELRRDGATRIPERIKAEIEAGRCSCDIRNPQGTCCLGDVNRAVHQARERLAGRPAPAVAAPDVQCAPPPVLQEAHSDCCRLPAAGVEEAVSRGGVQRLNRIMLPPIGVLVLAMVFFPHQMFALLPLPDSTGGRAVPAPPAGEWKAVRLEVPGMT